MLEILQKPLLLNSYRSIDNITYHYIYISFLAGVDTSDHVRKDHNKGDNLDQMNVVAQCSLSNLAPSVTSSARDRCTENDIAANLGTTT